MDRLKKVLGTSFFLGYLPVAPGTWASLGALIPIYFIITYSGYAGLLIAVILFSIATIWSADVCEKEWGKDPAKVVMDEWAGQSLTFLFFLFPYTVFIQHFVIILVAGFILFRIFDILKPLGVHKIQKIPGGWGILLDDLLAGLYANICLEILILFTFK